jgi:hypothetical protein
MLIGSELANHGIQIFDMTKVSERREIESNLNQY